MIPTPIRQVLSTIQANGIRALLMGGQACVFYGAAQVSKDVDYLVLADDENLHRMAGALEVLEATRIAVPAFEPDLLRRGHAVHFRCRAPGVDGLRIDIMTKLRDLPNFEILWTRRTIIGDDEGIEVPLLSVPDLVQAKKTQRSKDWPVIEALVAIHYLENSNTPKSDWVKFWLMETRSAESLIDLTGRFVNEAKAWEPQRPLLAHALARDVSTLRAALTAEEEAEKEKDRAYWEPLKRELEAFRRDERDPRNR